jgi:hypothetical protein
MCARNGETRSSREVEGNPGAIELSGSNLVLVEMKRLGWSIEQGQEDWQWRDKKRSRNQSIVPKIRYFLNYAQSLAISSAISRR